MSSEEEKSPAELERLQFAELLRRAVLLEKRLLERVDPAKGKFRTFLLTSMKNFLLDEWNKANAVHLGKTPVDDRLMNTYPHVLIHTSGEDVGLPDGVVNLADVVLMLSYFGAIFAASDPKSTLATVVSWVPLTAPFAMPGRIASGDAQWWEVLGAMGLTAVAAAVVLRLAERIYVRSVIHTDRKLGWREAWVLEG